MQIDLARLFPKHKWHFPSEEYLATGVGTPSAWRHLWLSLGFTDFIQTPAQTILLSPAEKAESIWAHADLGHADQHGRFTVQVCLYATHCTAALLAVWMHWLWLHHILSQCFCQSIVLNMFTHHHSQKYGCFWCIDVHIAGISALKLWCVWLQVFTASVWLQVLPLCRTGLHQSSQDYWTPCKISAPITMSWPHNAVNSCVSLTYCGKSSMLHAALPVLQLQVCQSRLLFLPAAPKQL